MKQKKNKHAIKSHHMRLNWILGRTRRQIYTEKYITKVDKKGKKISKTIKQIWQLPLRRGVEKSEIKFSVFLLCEVFFVCVLSASAKIELEC